jgi:hypothetical protein
MMKKTLLAMILLFSSLILPAQGVNGDRLPFQSIPLQDLSAFQSPSANWQIVGNVYANRQVPQMLEAIPGNGILANLSDSQNRGHLFTKLEHGDIELELDVMMAKESNSGIYFQGRYELQLQDSWGKRDGTRYGDLGGIYQRTDTLTNLGFEGSAPAVNASKAPGLWQHLRIIFKAPRFDQHGKKIANACFLKVYVNGSLVQDHFEVSGPTRSAAFRDEKPTGPIMFQGNHGRVAFKALSCKISDGRSLKTNDLFLKEYKSPGESFRNYWTQSPIHSTSTDSVSYLSATQKEINLLEFTGKMVFPESGNYLFKLQSGGGGALVINGDTVIHHDGVHGFDEISVGLFKAVAGQVSFTLVYNKLIGWRKGLTLFVEGPAMALHPLHAPGSVFHEPPVEPIIVRPELNIATIQRSFISDGARKRTHCLSVGMANAPSFTLDLASGALIQTWDGGFVETTPMWHRRGNQQIAIPLGTVIDLSEALKFGTVGHGENFRFIEYALDKRKLPVFTYLINGIEVIDQIIPSTEERSLTRRIAFQSKSDLTFRIASGTRIEQLPDGSFAMDDKNYYLTFDGTKPLLRNDGLAQELVVPVKGAGSHTIQYTLLW